MKVLDDLAARLPSRVGRLSERTIMGLVGSVYVGGGLVLPLGLAAASGTSVLVFVSLNFLAATVAWLLTLAWTVGRLEIRDRRLLVEWTTNLRLLSAQEFEWFAGEVFRREGWAVQETGSQDAGDGNVDLVLSRGNERVIAQCKRWTSWRVGVDEIRKFGGTLLAQGLEGKDGIFVTLSAFTSTARSEGQRLGLTLIDGPALHARAERLRRTEPCPVCEQPMILDRSPRGWWFRCVAARCSGKRDLGRDVSIAVELLTKPPSNASVHSPTP